MSESQRISDLLSFNNEFEARARAAERAIKELTTPRPIDEYHEDMGHVLWWKFPITEPPYVGTPNDVGREVTVSISVGTADDWPEPYEGGNFARYNIGGWPGYHTHFTPIPIPQVKR